MTKKALTEIYHRNMNAKLNSRMNMGELKFNALMGMIEHLAKQRIRDLIDIREYEIKRHWIEGQLFNI